jgi:hypothetical protein
MRVIFIWMKYGRKIKYLFWWTIKEIEAVRYTPWRRLRGKDVWLLLIFDFGTGWGVSCQHHALAVLYSRGNDPLCPLYRRLGGPQSRSEHRD